MSFALLRRTCRRSRSRTPGELVCGSVRVVVPQAASVAPPVDVITLSRESLAACTTTTSSSSTRSRPSRAFSTTSPCSSSSAGAPLHHSSLSHPTDALSPAPSPFSPTQPPRPDGPPPAHAPAPRSFMQFACEPGSGTFELRSIQEVDRDATTTSPVRPSGPRPALFPSRARPARPGARGPGLRLRQGRRLVGSTAIAAVREGRAWT